jgi:hypothetical protein
MDDAEYKLIVTNCGTEAVDLERIVDSDLEIDLTLSPTVTIQPGDSVEFTNDAGQTEGLLERMGACPNPDNQLENTATVSGTGANSGDFVEATDPACVKCDEDGDGIPDDQDECPDTVIPESVPTKRLGTNRFALVDEDTTFDTKAPKGKGPRKAFTIEDTAGCSCEQIVEELALGKGHVKFGCSISAMEEWVDAVKPLVCDSIKPITALMLVWDGVDGINVTTELGQVINGIVNGDVIFVNTLGGGNDFVVTISGAVSGQSEFHLSCSDEDMDGPEDCGKFQGNGKANNPSLINNWLFAGMEGDGGVIDCGVAP